MRHYLFILLVLFYWQTSLSQSEPFVREWPSALTPVSTGDSPETEHYTAIERVQINPGKTFDSHDGQPRSEIYLSEDEIYPSSYSNTPVSIDVSEVPLEINLEVGRVIGNDGISSSGMFTYTIPIEVSTGHGGIQPNLQLTYNHLAPNGPFGKGWSMAGLSSIYRKKPRPYDFEAGDGGILNNQISSGVNQELANSDLVLDGNRLVEISSDIADKVWTTERETFFRIIEETDGEGNIYFSALDQNGLTYTFGATPETRYEDQVWPLSKVEDVLGNYMEISYLQEENKLLPKRIVYGKNANQESGLMNEVIFTYQERSDDNVVYRDGHEYTTSVLVSAITCRTQGEVLSRYVLGYGSSDESYLTSVQQRHGNQTIATNPTLFSYHSPSEEPSLTLTFSELDEALGEKIVADFNGDGISDVYGQEFGLLDNNWIEEAIWRIYTGDGAGGFIEYASGEAPVNRAFVVGGIFTHNNPGLAKAFNFLASSAQQSGVPIPTLQSPRYASELGGTKAIFDFDGDGRDDLLSIEFGSSSDDIVTWITKVSVILIKGQGLT